MNTKALLVEDDAEIRDLVVDHLQRYGIAVEAVGSAAAMRAALAARRYELMLLDLMLPDGAGLDICRELRQTDHPAAAMPIIMLTAQGDPMSRAVGLEMGADDYLAKPFEPRELIARIHAVLRRAAGMVAPGQALSRAPVVHFAGWTFDRLRRTLVSPQQVSVQLSGAEFRLLSVFVDHPQKALSRERLLELWRAPGEEVSDRSIDLAVSRLRGKLGDTPRGREGEPGLIRTLRGEGYVFDAKVSA